MRRGLLIRHPAPVEDRFSGFRMHLAELVVRRSIRYRLKFRNGSGDIHPLHLHRRSFELTHVGLKPTAGVIKGAVMLGGYQDLSLDFDPDNPAATLFHWHPQLYWMSD